MHKNNQIYMPPSKEAIKDLGMRSHRTIIGHIAINPPEIEKTIKLKKASILKEMVAMTPKERESFIEKGPIDFVEDKENRVKFDIICSSCKEKVAYVWAKNEKLENWCDLHYVCWYDVNSWRGAVSVNVSPIDGKLGFKCACGEDTSDYRANRTLPPIQKQLMIEYTQKHRDFATVNSKFIGVQTK